MKEKNRKKNLFAVHAAICISCRQDHKPINVLTWLIFHLRNFFFCFSAFEHTYGRRYFSLHISSLNANSIARCLFVSISFCVWCAVAFVWTSRTDSTLTVLNSISFVCVDISQSGLIFSVFLLGQRIFSRISLYSCKCSTFFSHVRL